MKTFHVLHESRCNSSFVTTASRPSHSESCTQKKAYHALQNKGTVRPKGKHKAIKKNRLATIEQAGLNQSVICLTNRNHILAILPERLYCQSIRLGI